MKKKPYCWLSSDAIFCRICRRLDPAFNGIAYLALIILIVLGLRCLFR